MENIPGVLTSGLSALIDYTSWETPQIFRILQQRGKIPYGEMFRVFNMGIGMVMVCAKENADTILSNLVDSKIVGSIIEQNQEGSTQVIIENF